MLFPRDKCKKPVAADVSAAVDITYRQREIYVSFRPHLFYIDALWLAGLAFRSPAVAPE
jgi:hypothetical protein